MRVLRGSVWGLCLTVVAPAVGAQELLSDQFESPMTVADRWEPDLGRACRGDLFTISLPVGMGGGGLGDRDRAAIGESVLATAGGLFARRGGQIGIRWARVLSGDDRYWALAFVRLDADDNVISRLRVPPGQACFVVNSIRGALGVTFAGQPSARPGASRADDWAVGRECDAVGQASTTWYEDALLPPAILLAVVEEREEASPFAPGGGFWFASPPVKVAIVDGPMSEDASAWVTPPIQRVDGMRRGVKFGHADAMAWLVRRIASDASIHTFQALHANAMGTPVSQVASALERAVAIRPGIINLSLGWPPEMGRPAKLGGDDGCEAIEDPAGEAVRAVLAEAHRLNIRVVTAAGNRVGPMPSAVHVMDYDDRDTAEVYGRQFPCVSDGWSDRAAERPVEALPAGLFYPAAWSEVPTCIPSGKQTRLGTLAIQPVAAYGKRGQRVLGGADLAAPGIDVDLIGHPPGVPGTMTGTSVAAALTTGFIARRAAETGRTAGAVFDSIFDDTARCGLIESQRFLRSCTDAPLGQRRSRRFPQIAFKDAEEAPEKAAFDGFAGAFHVIDFESEFGPPSILGGGSDTWTAGDAWLWDTPSPLDRFAAGGLGPQPEIDPCDDDCFFLAERAARGEAALDLRMSFGALDVELTHVGIEMQTDRLQTIKLPTRVRDEMNRQIVAGKGALTLIISGVPMPAAFDKRAALWLVYDVDDGTKQITRRRSRLEPAYKIEQNSGPVLQLRP